MTNFNSDPTLKMHLDINSCFATIEQQANPLLRNKPVVIASRDTPQATIVAASYEAKAFGIKTGTKVNEAKEVLPNIIVLEPDPDKYRDAHLKIREVLNSYTDNLHPKSIDEFVMDFTNMNVSPDKLLGIGQNIKDDIRKRVGEYISVSIGIGASRFIAKTASNVIKPNGLYQIDPTNYLDVYSKMTLPDLYGINKGYTARLNSIGIFNVLDFYNAQEELLFEAFKSVGARFWYLRIRGYEVDDVEWDRKSFGNSYVLRRPTTFAQIGPILMKLVVKTAKRLRDGGFKARGIHLGILYDDNTYWHQGKKLEQSLFDERDIYRELFKILNKAPSRSKKIKKIAESCFYLVRKSFSQLDLFNDVFKKTDLITSIDLVNDKFGQFAITPGRMVSAKDEVPDALGFGRIRELNDRIAGV